MTRKLEKTLQLKHNTIRFDIDNAKECNTPMMSPSPRSPRKKKRNTVKSKTFFSEKDQKEMKINVDDLSSSDD